MKTSGIIVGLFLLPLMFSAKPLCAQDKFEDMIRQQDDKFKQLRKDAQQELERNAGEVGDEREVEGPNPEHAVFFEKFDQLDRRKAADDDECHVGVNESSQQCLKIRRHADSPPAGGATPTPGHSRGPAAVPPGTYEDSLRSRTYLLHTQRPSSRPISWSSR